MHDWEKQEERIKYYSEYNPECNASVSWLLLLLHTQMPTLLHYSKHKLNIGARQNQPVLGVGGGRFKKGYMHIADYSRK